MSNKAGWYIAGHGVYMLHMLVSEWQGSRWCNYNMRGFYKCVNHRSVHTELKQHKLKVGNRLAAKYRFPFFIYTMRAKACCACRVSRLTMNLNYSARRTTWNTIRRQMLSDFVLFHAVHQSESWLCSCQSCPCSVEPEELTIAWEIPSVLL